MKKIIVVFLLLIILIVTQKMHRVVAEEVGSVLGVMKEKLGFEIGDASVDFIFSKITPNYAAYAGDQRSLGGHTVRLERDGAILDVSFVKAENQKKDAEIQSFSLSQGQEQLLDQAEQILSSSAISPTDRLLIDNARAIVASYSAQPLETDDFLFLVQLKSFKIKRLSLDVDLKLAEISRDISTVMSKAALVEEEHERKVSFTDIPLGLSIDYRLREEGMRQEIILHTKDNIHARFTFLLHVHGLQYKNMGNGVWYFSDNVGAILRFPKGYAIDSNGALQNDVEAVIEKKYGNDMLTLSVSESWLREATRVFPVRIITGIEVIPELRQGNNGLRILVTPTPLPSPSPTIATPSATPISSPSVTPTFIPSPVATESGNIDIQNDISI